MARRRLNKKVALMGSTVFLILAMLAVVVILRLTRDPAQFEADGDAAWAARDYETARRNYAEALGRTRASQDKIDLYFKLAEVYRVTDDWRRVLACWEHIIISDPQNVRARLGRLKYYHILADSLSQVGQNVANYWKDVSTQAIELLEVIRGTDLLDQDKAPWEPSFGAAEPGRWDGGIARLGSYLHFAAGRAALELARMGASVNPDELLAKAKSHLQEAKQRDPGNTGVYRYLAAAFQEQARIAESKGNLDLREQAVRQAEETLAEAVGVAGDQPGPHIDALSRRLAEAKAGSLAQARDRMKALEGDYQALVERFPSSAETFSSLAEFYALQSAYLHTDAAAEKLDRALAAVDRGLALDPTNVRTFRLAAGLYYRRFTLYGDESGLHKAVKLAETALELPETQDRPGPTQYAAQMYRASLCALLGRFHLELTRLPDRSASDVATTLGKAEKVVHEIEQIQGSGENPQVIKWRGMLELARGRTGQAVRDLWAAYEQIGAASGPDDEGDAFLSYTLAELFKNSSEIGAVIEFLGSALNSGIINTRPETVLDYGEALLRVHSYDVALSAVNSYEERFGTTPRSRSLRVRALLAKGHVTEAEEAIAQLDPADPNTLRVRLILAASQAAQLQEAIQRRTAAPPAHAEATTQGQSGETEDAVRAMQADLRECRRQQADLARRLLLVDPNGVDGRRLETLCRMLIEQNDVAAAEVVVETFLKHSGQDVEALFCQRLLSEPDPSACSESRRREIRLQAIHSLSDPVVRAAELGLFHEAGGQLDEAVAQWQSVLDATESQDTQAGPAYLRSGPPSWRHRAIGQLFDIACRKNDWSLAEKTVELAAAENLDDCEGHLFAGRLAFARERYTEALTHLDECLKLRPIFSYGYMLRSNVQAALGNEHACVEDAQKASDLNPVDPSVARTLANALLVRNKGLGDRVSAKQRDEAQSALERAIQLNPRDTQVLLAYASLVDETDPVKALGIRQTIQITAPSLENAVMLGRLATRIAVEQADPSRKGAFFAIAETAFDQARHIDAHNAFMLQSYAEYYRVTGQPDKAAQLLADSQDGRLLWRHYYWIGRYEEARRCLETLLHDPANESDALKGLILVAQATGDRDAVKTYSERLLSQEDNAANRLAQIRAFLDLGLVLEAEHKLQSLKERYPDEPRLLVMEALLAKCQGRLERALELTNRHLEKNQQDAMAWRLRGEISQLMGDYDQAILDFRKSRLLADDPDTAVALANAYVWAGRDEEAVSELLALLKTPAAPPSARTLLERTYRRLGRDDALEQFYSKTLAEFPDSIAWLTRAGAFAIDRGDFDEALRRYGKAYRLQQSATSDLRQSGPQQAAVLDGYLHSLILSAADPDAGNSWRPERLDELFREAGKHVDTDWGAIALCRMAEARKKLGDDAEAGRLCRQAIEKAWSNDRLAAEILLRVRRLLGPEEVSRYCRDKLATTPDSLAANVTMFHLARIENDYDDAVEYVDRCIALSESDPGTRRGSAAYTLQKADVLTVAYQATSDKRYLQEAVGVYESLAQKMPTNHSVLNNLAYLLAQSEQRLDEAQRYAERALNADPYQAAYLDTYAFVLHKKGNDAAAVRFITAAIQQYEMAQTASAAVYEHLGMIKEGLGDKTGALAAYRHALERADDERSDVAQRLGLAIERLQAAR
ncbi:MAG TPA: hypothetical protein P5068_05160 [Sedimentisphaerales bacterium]|nr:hypothetical protein [Sedimentisphaerales bacterium]HRV47131.1 hypothetical protein [Sedimentisphaerales bacterium]